MLQRIMMFKKIQEELIPNMIKFVNTLKKIQEMKKKKDKVTLKGVDKPEVFQHWTEDQVLSTINSCKELIGDIDYAPIVQASYDGKAIHSKYDELTGKILYTVVDPYHIEPIDNPQKPKHRFVDPVKPISQKEVNGLLNTDFEHTGEEVQNSRGFFTSVTVKNSELKPVYARILKAMVLDQLMDIQRNHPEVLKQFIEEHYGK